MSQEPTPEGSAEDTASDRPTVAPEAPAPELTEESAPDDAQAPGPEDTEVEAVEETAGPRSPEPGTAPPDAAPPVEPAADEPDTAPPVDKERTADEPVADEPAADEPVADEPSTRQADDPSASTDAPRPVPRPVPRPPARPLVAPTPAEVATTAPSVVPAPPSLSPTELAEAARWGRVDDDGTVWVREASGEREVGQYPGAEPGGALAFYVRRYDDLHAKVVLFEARVSATDLSAKEMDTTLDHLTEELTAPTAVGDLDRLRRRLQALHAVAEERRSAAEVERAAARQAALDARTELVDAAERIAETDPSRIQWRPAGEQLRSLLDQWKDAQRHGPRLDRATEDALWKRFSHARSTFDRERRRFFSELEKQNAAAKADKERLVAEAEALATSTDWGATTAAYRDLMARWKDAGRASRKDDDAVWARFRAAQDAFFAARDAQQRQTDAEFGANLQLKLGLLEEAELLVPVRDIAAARAALRDLQERWERAGKVPRGDVQRVEGRLRAVEQAVRDAEQSQWRRSNPETRARAEGAAAQLTAAIAGLEQDLAAARASGDDRKVAEVQTALDARRAWLEQVERAASDS